MKNKINYIAFVSMYFLFGFSAIEKKHDKISKVTLNGVVVSQRFIQLKVEVSPLNNSREELYIRKQSLPLSALVYEGPQIDSVLHAIDITTTEILFKQTNGSKAFSVSDYDVNPANNYVYWITDKNYKIIAGPLCLKIRDKNLWWPQTLIEQKINLLSYAYPDMVDKVNWGHTFEGRPLNGLVIGNPKNAIALIGNTHAGESGGELIMYTAMQLLKNNKDVLKDAGIIILPVLNIDSRNKLIEGRLPYIRKNANQVDLNRNYQAGWDKIEFMYEQYTNDPISDTYRGKSPNSEPETKAVIGLIRKFKPQLVMAYHWLGAITGNRILYSGNTREYNNTMMGLVNEFEKGFMNKEKIDTISNYLSSSPSPGSLHRYCSEVHNIPCMIVEGRQTDNVIETRAYNDQASAEDLAIYQEKHYRAVLKLLQYLGEKK